MENEIAKQNSKDIITTSSGNGLENISSEDIMIPRVKVLYSLSSEMKDKELRDTLKQGMIINTNTKKEIKNPVFSVLNFFKMYVKFNPMKANGKDDKRFNPNLSPGATVFVAYSKNDPRINQKELEWEDNLPPLVTEMRGFLVLFEGDDMPCVLSFYKTSAKSGKELTTKIFVPGKPAWENKFKLYADEETKIGNYYILKTILVGKNSEEEKAKCAQMYEMFSKHAHRAMEEETKDGVETERPF